MQEIIIDHAQAGQRLDKYLSNRLLPLIPWGLLRKQLRSKNITLNDKKASGSEIIREGDRIKCYFSRDTFDLFAGNGDPEKRSPEKKSPEMAGKKVPSVDQALLKKKEDCLQENRRVIQEAKKAYASPVFREVELLYEDEDILALNKPSGILSQKAKESDADRDLSINEYARGYLLHSGSASEKSFLSFRPSICNRLDRSTSGIILCSKTPGGAISLSEFLGKKDGYIDKYYLAITCPSENAKPLEQDHIYRHYLSKDKKNNMVSLLDASDVSVPKPDGWAECEAAFHVLAKDPESGMELVEIKLLTGRSHQIRAQLSFLGHPILGDPKYGMLSMQAPGLNTAENKRKPKDPEQGRKSDAFGQYLHAYSILMANGIQILANPPARFLSKMEQVFQDDIWERIQKRNQERNEKRLPEMRSHKHSGS